jgi:hypothetical protein
LIERIRNISLEAGEDVERSSPTYTLTVRGDFENMLVAAFQSFSIGEDLNIFFGQDGSLVGNMDVGLTGDVGALEMVADL